VYRQPTVVEETFERDLLVQRTANALRQRRLTSTRVGSVAHQEKEPLDDKSRLALTGENGYDFAAASAALCARLASAPGFAATGALTPSQAFGARALLDGLAGAGVRHGSSTTVSR